MGSFSIWHWLIVLVIVMLIFGTKKLRNMGADLGGAVRGFKDGMREGGEKPADVKPDINREVELDELRKMRDSMQQAASSFESSVQTELHKTETDLNKSVEDVVAEAPAE